MFRGAARRAAAAAGAAGVSLRATCASHNPVEAAAARRQRRWCATGVTIDGGAGAAATHTPNPKPPATPSQHQLYKVQEYTNLSKRSRAALVSLGYKVLFPVQAAAFEPIHQGKNVAIKSSTGSGKTLSYVLPIVDMLIRSAVADAFYPHVLVLVPSRDLAPQIASTFLRVSGMNLSVLWVGGGRSLGQEVEELKRGVDILVGTPGRIRHHMRDGHIRLDHLRTLVIEEADFMLRDRHASIQIDILDVIRDVIVHHPPRKLDLMTEKAFNIRPGGKLASLVDDGDARASGAAGSLFDNMSDGGEGEASDSNGSSSSFSERFAAAQQLREMSNDPPAQEDSSDAKATTDAPAPAVQVIVVSATHPNWMTKMYRLHSFFQPMNIVDMIGRDSPATSPFVQHEAIMFPEFVKTALIRHLIVEHLRETDGRGRVLVFIQKMSVLKRCQASQLLRSLVEKRAALPVISRHQSNDERQTVLRELQDGTIPFVVATDMASRGLDVDALSLVINVELPAAMTTYVNRAGRVGRGGKAGKVVTILSPGDTAALQQVEQSINARVRLRELPSDVMTRLREQTREETQLYTATSRFHGISSSTNRRWGTEWYADPTWGR